MSEKKPKSQQADCLTLNEFFEAFTKKQATGSRKKPVAKPIQRIYDGGCTKRDATYIIGIDPDTDKSGLACWQRAKGHARGQNGFFATLQAITFFDLFDYVQGAFPVHMTYIRIGAGWLNPKTNFQAQRKNSGSREKQSAAIGANHEIGKKQVTRLVQLGYTVELVEPEDAKWNAEKFKLITGLPYGYNQDIRDAAKDVFNS